MNVTDEVLTLHTEFSLRKQWLCGEVQRLLPKGARVAWVEKRLKGAFRQTGRVAAHSLFEPFQLIVMDDATGKRVSIQATKDYGFEFLGAPEAQAGAA